MIGPRRAASGLLLLAGLSASASAATLSPAEAEPVVVLLESAAEQGLEPGDYEAAQLRAELARAAAAGPRSSAWAAFEDRLERSALRYGRELAMGRVEPEEAGVRWLLERRRVDVDAAWRLGLARGEPAAALRRLAPEHPEYHLLQAALARLLREGGDPALVRRLGLNLERWRWMPDRLGATHARVNLPAFELRLIEDGRRTLVTRVIVGKRGWETPGFTDSLGRVMVNPYWNVPDVIARNEVLPKLKQDPAHLQRRRYTVLDGWAADAAIVDPRGIDWRRYSAASFPFRLRQEPGAGNALGRLIFMLDNDFEIYLHDTPGRRLFERANRALSHGCVRVESARELATQLFAREGRAQELSSAIAAGRNAVLELGQAVPLHVVHFTVEPEGARLVTHPDLYGIDESVERALRARRLQAVTGQ